MDWQPISTAPTDGTVIDLWMVDEAGRGWREENAYYVENRPEFINFKSTYRAGWFGTNQDYGDDDFCDRPAREWAGVIKFKKPTHWMPLPKPPVTE